MVLTWAVWMLGSAVHYTFLPRCLLRSWEAVVDFAIVQAALTGIVSGAMRRLRRRPAHQEHQERPGHPVDAGAALAAPATAKRRANVLIAGGAFAVAISMTNASVAYGSVSGSRMIKSLEPAIVSGIQLMAGMDHRVEFPWVCLLAVAVSMMLAVAPTGITMLSAAAALLSTAGISTRNVFVKKQMAAGAKAYPAPASCAESARATRGGGSGGGGSGGGGLQLSTDPQTSLNFVACVILIAFASYGTLLGGWGSNSYYAAFVRVHMADLVIASASFAAFQVAALMVLERVSPTRQAAIKSLQNALITAWTLVIDSRGKRHTPLEIVPALVWGLCVMALTMDARLSGARLAASGKREEWQSLPIFRQGQGGRAGTPAHRKDGLVHGGGDSDGISACTKDAGQPASSGRSRVVASIVACTWLVVYCACALALLVQCAVMALNSATAANPTSSTAQ
jgi:hypothetical protein